MAEPSLMAQSTLPPVLAALLNIRMTGRSAGSVSQSGRRSPHRPPRHKAVPAPELLVWRHHETECSGLHESPRQYRAVDAGPRGLLQWADHASAAGGHFEESPGAVAHWFVNHATIDLGSSFFGLKH